MPHVERLLDHFLGVRPQGHGDRACCPAHDDAHPSFNFKSQSDGHVRLSCRFGSCSLASSGFLLEAGYGS